MRKFITSIFALPAVASSTDLTFVDGGVSAGSCAELFVEEAGGQVNHGSRQRLRPTTKPDVGMLECWDLNPTS